MNNLNQQAIENCLAIIRKEQLPDGEFLHRSWPKDFLVGTVEEAVAGERKYKTTFFAANILTCLNSVVPSGFAKQLSPLRKSVVRFLMAQKSGHWSFNYWARDSQEAITLPYPDDLDDTFVALAALYGYDPALIDGAALACVAKMLTLLEAAPGGPYRTWLVGTKSVKESDAGNIPSEWRDIDIAVNANIGYFLSFVPIHLPNLSRFVDERIEQGSLSSPYYPGAVQPIYFISRFYQGAKKPELADTLSDILSGARGKENNPLELAMTISALINLGSTEKIPPRSIEWLIAFAGQEQKFLQPYPFCIDPSRNGQTYFAGANSLTAAFCAEAIAKYALHSATQTNVAQPAKTSSSPSHILLARIKMMAQATCYALPEILKAAACEAIEQIENEEVVMAPYIARTAIRNCRDIPVQLLDKLALANLYGWIAYSIYDDFLDCEVVLGGEVAAQKLSVANFFLRELTLQYAALDLEIPGIRDEFTRMMNIIDEANAAESMRVNVIGFDAGAGPLADRSLGHALPALAVFMAAGITSDSSDAVTLILFFKNYLAARQLHDDAHDWEDDLRRGRVNGAAMRMLTMRSESGKQGGWITSDDFTVKISEFQKFFWRVAIERIVGDILDFLDKARTALSTIEMIEDPAPFEALLTLLEVAAQYTLRERNETVKFLDLYLSTA